MECLIARLKLNMPGSSTPDEGAVTRLYVKALHSLQAALNSHRSSKAAETLCSVMLLRIYELMCPSDKACDVSKHVSGAAQLIQHRGPEAFKTDFERELLTANAGPIVTAFLMNNETCFLAEPRWTEVFKEAIQADNSYCVQSGLAADLWETLVMCPELCQAVTYIICSGHAISDEERQDVIQQIQSYRRRLQDWHITYQQNLSNNATKSHRSLMSVNDNVKRCSGLKMRHEVYATFLSCLILGDRLLYALAPCQFQYLEVEAQELSQEIVDLQERGNVGNDPLQAGLFKVQTVWNARATLATKDSWQGTSARHGNGVIEKAFFEDWCRRLGRKST